MDIHVRWRWLHELGACPIPCLLSSIASCGDAINLLPHIGGHSWEYPVAVFPTYCERSRLDFGFGFKKEEAKVTRQGWSRELQRKIIARAPGVRSLPSYEVCGDFKLLCLGGM